MPVATGPAETLIVNANLFTVPWKTSRPGELALREGKIVAVGAPGELADLRGARTQVVDAEQGLVTPGFHDVHVHPLTAGLVLDTASMLETVEREATIDVIVRYARERPEREWVTGWGWNQEAFPPAGPDRELLDRLVPDRPAYLTRADGHAAVVNSRALELAGVADDAPDPEGGRLERYADGRPTGLLHEWAMKLVQRIIPENTAADRRRGLLRGQDHLLSLGVTSWQDASVGAEELDAYWDLEQRGELRAHVRGALWWDAALGFGQLPELLERRTRYATTHFAPTTVKVMLDGVVEGSRSAAVLEPYIDPATGRGDLGAGKSFLEPAELNAVVSALAAHGFQVHYHAIGDRAVREGLDALEAAAIRHGAPAHPPVISHIQLVHPSDVPRFAALGAVASAQAYWAALDLTQVQSTIPHLGPERSARQYPFRSLVDAGAVLAGGSDWMISSAYPMDAIHVAVNRAHFDPPASGRRYGRDRPGPFYPDNAITLAEGLAAYTFGGAWANGTWRERGRLAPGLRADLVLLDRDPFAGPADRIAAAQVRAAYIDGTPLHRSE
ncbi:MAG: amidohydrolase [Bifidobacteriaceae bacterium]|jgi:predicted amidohydrolase YtcJ|nr:amidohydrolase [Bifidobacteriaceae bacterium]